MRLLIGWSMSLTSNTEPDLKGFDMSIASIPKPPGPATCTAAAAEATTPAAMKVSDHGQIARVYHLQARVPGCPLLCEETDLGGGFTPI